MNDILGYLKDGDLRSIASVDQLVERITTQAEFDKLFDYLYSENRLIAMRAADAVEKVTRQNPQFLVIHKAQYFGLLEQAKQKEQKWHLAQLAVRFDYTAEELAIIWQKLQCWVENKKESKLVRVNALQAMYDLAKYDQAHQRQFNEIAKALKAESVPSIDARLRKLQY